MKKSIISLGIIDKKLIWPFLYSLIQIIKTIYDRKYPKDKQTDNTNSLGTAVGQIMHFIIPFIIKYKKPKKEKNCTKSNILHYFFLLLFNGIFYGLLATNMSKKDEKVNPHDSTFCTKEAIEIIFITLVTFFFLKYRYFIHHIIGLVMFSLSAIMVDILLDGFEENFNYKTTLQKIIEIVVILLEVVNYCYHKYMMERLYHNYWNLNIALGLFLFVAIFFYSIISLDKFITEAEAVGVGYIFLSFFLNAVIGFFSHLTRILTLHYETPNHMLIAYDINRIFIILTQLENENKWYSIIFFLLQFFFLMFYLEILEFNFCNLNKNTKKSINKRSDNDMLVQHSNTFGSDANSTFELKEGYVMKSEVISNQDLDNVSANEERDKSINSII